MTASASAPQFSSSMSTNRPSAPTAKALFKSVLAAHRPVFVQAAIASLLINLLAMASATYSMQVYDRVIPTKGIATLLVLTSGVLIAAILELAIKLARSHILEHAIKQMDLELSQAIFARLLGIRLDQFPPTVGTLSAQLRSYEAIRGFASTATLFLAVDTPFALLFLIAIALIAGVEVALVPLVFFVLAVSVGLFYRQRINQHAHNSTHLGNFKVGMLIETIEGAQSLKTTGAGPQQLAAWNYISQKAIDDDVAVRHYSDKANYLSAFIQQMSYVFMVATGAWIASQASHTGDGLTTGGLIAASILSGRVLAPVAAVPTLLVQWAHARSALDSLEKVFALERDHADLQAPLTPQQIQGQFQVQDLRFTYPGRPQTLAVENLLIRPGEKVGILGPIGSGKSTLLKVLTGLFKAQSGRILLDGLDVQQISRLHLSKHLGYLPQDVRLFAGTLRSNLCAGLGLVDEQALLQACQLTGLLSVIANHPRGLDLPIHEGGGGLSGGQRQLVGLTRLILGQPTSWLLDEPTASMDDASEQHSLHALRQAIQPAHTVILVTHKAALLDLVDRLIVLSPQGIPYMDGHKSGVLELLQLPPPELAARLAAIRQTNVEVPTGGAASSSIPTPPPSV
jgi:ATP-binding cassette subfamily C protein LapB